MRFFTYALTLLLIASGAFAQPFGLNNGQTPAIGFANGDCVTITGAGNGTVIGASCSAGSVTPSGTLTNNAVILGNGGSSVKATTTGTGIVTALGVNVGSAGAPILLNGAGGTPSSLTLTSATGLPLSSGISGFGTGIATALAINIGSAGAPVLFNGALGTPASGVGTNLIGTAAGLTAGNVTTNANLTGDVTSVGNATTLASVASAGTTGSSTAIPVITINAKGLTTGITTAAVVAPAGTLSGSALAAAVTSASFNSITSATSLSLIAASGNMVNLSAGTGSSIALQINSVTNALFTPVSDGVLRLTNSVGGFTRLILGTNDASGAALKKNGASIDIVDGNDGNFTGLRALTLTANGGSITSGTTIATAAPAGSSSNTWKLGALQSGAVVLDTTRSVFVDIGGTVYKLMVAQ